LESGLGQLGLRLGPGLSNLLGLPLEEFSLLVEVFQGDLFLTGSGLGSPDGLYPCVPGQHHQKHNQATHHTDEHRQKRK
jgi:hypothetical protein